MEKNFDEWNKIKKKIDRDSAPPYFREGHIWLAHLGLNIGTEVNGKNSQYLRPVLIIKKYNPFSMLILPLSTSAIRNKYRVSIGHIVGKEVSVNLSQLRNMDHKRLRAKISALDPHVFKTIKKRASEVNFS